MSMRLPFVRRTAGMLLLVLPLFAPARLPAGEECHLVRVTYQVADLVIPRPEVVYISAGPARKTATATQEAQLIKLFTSTIEPRSWSDKGGPGTIDYHPLTMSLVVNQTPDVQEQIVDLLNSLRRLQDTQVSLEVRFLSVSEACAERLGADGKDSVEISAGAASESPLRVTFLKAAQVYRKLEAAQGDRRTNVMQAPKLTMFDGETAVLDLTEPQDGGPNHYFFNAFTPAREASPDVEKAPTGLRMTAKPVVCADRRFVRLNLNANLTSLDNPEAERIGVGFNGDDGPAVQAPHLSRLTLDCVLKIPDGGTAFISGWKREREVRTEFGPPILSEIPYLNRLFKNVGYSREPECVLLMVTPRIIAPAEEEERQTGFHLEQPANASSDAVQPAVAPPCCRNREAAALVEKYHRACAGGHNAEATQLAVQALAIDPACFHAAEVSAPADR